MKRSVKKRLGDMLVEGGLLEKKQLMQALQDQKRANMKLGQYLIHKGIVKEGQIVNLMSQQLRIKKYNAKEFPVDSRYSDLIPSDLAEKFQLAPLKKDGFIMTVAMLDPMDINAVDAIEISTNCELEAVICTEQELGQLQNALYGSFTGLDDILDEMSIADVDEAEDSDISLGNLQDQVEEAPVIKLVNSILSQAVKEGASDVHVSPEKKYVQVRFRVDGRLQEVPAPPKHMVSAIVSRFKILANMDIASSRIPQDGRFAIKIQNKEINIRASTLPTIYGENLVLRLLDTSGGALTLDQLGYVKDEQKKVLEAIHQPYGMLLCAGPTGSGKSTSLFSVLDILNKPDVNITTLEDPVEYRMEKVRQVQLNRKAGMTFASGLRSILRQDPDVIMVGEIRDRETAQISIESALTGHMVMSTVHTNDSAQAVTRFVEMGIEPFLLASTLLAVIAQRLVRRVCSNCQVEYQPSPEALRRWGLDQVKDAVYRKGDGCHNCLNTGYKGRLGLYEVLMIDDEVQHMILREASSQEIIKSQRSQGKLRTLMDDAAGKIIQGHTTLEEAANAVMS